MRDRFLPSDLFEYGPDDRVFDGLLVAGGCLILLVGVVGRHVVTELLAAAYVGGFLGYLVYKGLKF